MLMSLDRDKSKKKFSGSRKKFLDEKFLHLKFALEQMWALKCLRTRHDVFVLWGGWRPPLHQPIATASGDAVGVRLAPASYL